jgi:hypothetical protein
MKTDQYFSPILQRIFILAIISAVLVLGFSELAYQIFGEDVSRRPTTIELNIPRGTSLRIENGEAIPEIPEEMVFVVGDTLLVNNMDLVDHQLGPLWIPSGTSASLKMDQKQNVAYTCTFQSSRYLGLTIKEAITWKSRLGALAYAAPPTLVFLLVYSIVMFPIKPKDRETQLHQNEIVNT